MNSPLRTQLEDHLPRIRSIVSRIARDEGMVDDLAQETCLRLIEKESLWKPERGALAQWINAVTRNLAIRQTGRRRAERSRQGSLAGDIAMEDTAPAFDEDQIAWVLAQFGTLPDMQRRVVHLHYFEQKTLTAIGEELGTSRQVVAYQLHKALGTLRKRAGVTSRLALLLPWNWDLQGCVLRLRAALAQQGELTMIKTTLSLALLAGVAVGGYQMATTTDDPGVTDTGKSRTLAVSSGVETGEVGNATVAEISGADASRVKADPNAATTAGAGADDAEGETVAMKPLKTVVPDIYDKLQTLVYHAVKDRSEFKVIWDIHYGESEGKREIPEMSSADQLAELRRIFDVEISYFGDFQPVGDIRLNYGERHLASCLSNICEHLTDERPDGDRQEVRWAVIDDKIVVGSAHDFEADVKRTMDTFESNVRAKRKREAEDRARAVEAFLDKSVEWSFDNVEIGRALNEFGETNLVPLRVYTDKLWAQKVTLSGSGTGRDLLDAVVGQLEPTGQIEWTAKEGNLWVYDRVVVEKHRAERREREEAEERHRDEDENEG